MSVLGFDDIPIRFQVARLLSPYAWALAEGWLGAALAFVGLWYRRHEPRFRHNPSLTRYGEQIGLVGIMALGVFASMDGFSMNTSGLVPKPIACGLMASLLFIWICAIIGTKRHVARARRLNKLSRHI